MRRRNSGRIVLMRDVRDRIEREAEQYGGEYNSQPLRRTSGQIE